MFKKIKKNIKFGFLLILCVLLILMVIFNNYTYTFPNEINLQYNNDSCKTVYYEPYNIFSYRKLSSLSNWITKDGKMLRSVTLPGSDVYLMSSKEGKNPYTLEASNVFSSRTYTLSSKEYEQFKKEGISTNESSPTKSNYFIGGYSEDDEYKVSFYKPNEILGRIKACKE